MRENKIGYKEAIKDFLEGERKTAEDMCLSNDPRIVEEFGKKYLVRRYATGVRAG